MKHILAILTGILLGASAVQAAAPETVPALTGDLVKAYALTQVDHATITSYYYQPGPRKVRKSLDTVELDVSQVTSLEDLRSQLADGELDFTLPDPRLTVYVEAMLTRNGSTVFESYNTFKLEKTGPSEYEVPWYASYLYFDFVGIEIPLANAASAKLVDTETGKTSRLSVTSTGLYITNAMIQNQAFDTLEVVFKDGTVGHYDRSGSIVVPEHVEGLTFGSVEVGGIRRAYVDEEGVVNEYTAPEYGYNPALQITVPESGEVELEIESEYGYEPLLVHVTTFEELASGIAPQVFEYYWGIEIEAEPGSVILILPEFAADVVGSGNGGGGKG